MKNVSRGNIELIYELSRSVLGMVPSRTPINEQLMAIPGVRQVNLIMQSEEVSR